MLIMTVQQRIESLILTKLGGRVCDTAKFVDRLLPIVAEVGEIRCSLSSDHALGFQVPGDVPFQTRLHAARAKLRAICARLGLLAMGEDGSLYGGEADFSYGPNPGNPMNWNLRFRNTTVDQEFVLTAR